MKNLLIILILVCFGLTEVRAESYSLEQFLALVKENSKDLQLARKDLDMAAAIKKEAWATALPKVFAKGDYIRNLKENVLFIGMPDPDTDEMTTQKFQVSFKNDVRFNIALQQPLFSFKIGDALTAAKQYEKLSGYVFDAQNLGILTFAKKGFYQALLLKKLVEVSKASEKSALDNFTNIKDKFDNGLVSELELLQAEMRWKNQVPVVTESERNYKLLLENLKNFAGLNPEEELSFSGSLDTYPAKPERMKASDVFKLRPDYNALLWEKNLRGTDVKSQYSEYLPTLDGSFVYSFSSISDEWDLANRNENYMLGLSLNIPIYTGGYTGAQLQKAKIGLDKSKIKLMQARENISNELDNIYLRLDEAEQRIISARSTIETSRKAYSIAETSAENGLITQLDLRDTRVYLDQAELNYYMAVFDYLNAYFDWEQASGQKEK